MTAAAGEEAHAGYYGARRAVDELTAIFDAQWSNGLLPHIRFFRGPSGYRPDAVDWGVPATIIGHGRVETSGITQPPIMGLCTWYVYRRLPNPAPYAGEFVNMTRALDRFHRFLLDERDPTGDGLAACIHPWETGTDNSPAFEPLLQATRRYLQEHRVTVEGFGRADTTFVDPSHRPTDRDYLAYFGLIALFKQHGYDQRGIAARSPFLLQDVLFNVLLVVSLEALARLKEALAGDRRLETADWRPVERDNLLAGARKDRATGGRVAAAIRRCLWSDDDGLFYARDAWTRRLIPVPTVSSLTPLLGDVAGPDCSPKLIEHLLDPGQFATPYPVPSTAAGDPAFDPLRYWAGPSWPVPNWLLVKALADSYPDISGRLRRRTLEMIAEGEEDLERVAAHAAALIEANDVDGRTTTPSRGQYQHAWLWDSAIAAVGWTYVEGPTEPVLPSPIDGIYVPSFSEYYHPNTGEPLGARFMTWTAAVFLDLLRGV